MKEELTRSEIQTSLWVIGGLIFSNLGAVIGLIRWPIRNHLRRIEKIEYDLVNAHRKIRDMQKSDCAPECPLKVRR